MLVRTQLTRLDGHLAGRQQIAARLCAALDGVPGIHMPHVPVWHREEDARLADADTAAVAKVASYAKDLL
ncbi:MULTISPECIES: hypothetical protein [Streptomyces]|uniref:Uncharacterized protein n=1 Tax=Streptomyces griseocarneus TaxID=51201 RepID=A0ABX7RWF5_9ACTN|nr:MULTISPECIES: hypothetical protein [Streptomyces]QSY50993.1 hypothetical protein J3S04_08850 [Streptomyces griseocarneus]